MPLLQGRPSADQVMDPHRVGRLWFSPARLRERVTTKGVAGGITGAPDPPIREEG